MLRRWVVGILIGYGIVAAISMVILGWPESTPYQVALLQLAGVPLQLALAVGLWQLSRRMRPLDRRGRRWLRVAAVLAGVGVVGVLLAYLTGPRGLVHAGLALIWVGLLVTMVVVVTHLPRHPVRTSSFTRLADRSAEEPEDDGPAAPAAPAPPAPVAAPDDGSVESRRD